MAFEEKIFEIIAKVSHTDAAGITRETEYVKDLNVTKSVAYFQLAAMLDAELGIKLNFQKLRTKTVGETIDYINSMIQQK